MALLRRNSAGFIRPRIEWLYYAANEMALYGRELTPFMLLCGIAMHTAIGAAAAIGIPVAVVGTLGYIASGLQIGKLPDYSFGFVYVPALLALVLGSIVTAPFGARAAHRLPVAILGRIFAGLLYVLATKMLVTYW